MNPSMKKTQVSLRNLNNYIRLGKLNEVKATIEEYGMNYDKNWHGGYALLLYALKHKQKLVAEYLLSQNPSLCDDQNRSLLLHTAVQNKFKKIVEVLLDRGADILMKDSTFRTPLQLALDLNCFTIAELIITKRGIVKLPVSGSANSLLHRALLRSLVIVKMLLKSKPKNLNINCLQDGYTPLHRAILDNNVSLVKLLLENNADMNFKLSMYEYQEYTALHLAVYEGNAEIVSLLLQNGANVHAKDKKKETPFFLALFSHRSTDSVLQAFISNNVDLDSPIKDNRPPLYWALSLKSESKVKLLVKSGANIDIVDDQGESLLDHFIKLSNLDAVKILITYGADVRDRIQEFLNLFDEQSETQKSQGDKGQLLKINLSSKTNIINCLVAKLHAVRKVLGQDDSADELLEKHKSKRKEILDQLKKRYVCGNITFYSILRCPPQKIAMYLTNPNFITATKDVDWVEEIPLFGGLMLKNLGAAAQRRTILEEGRELGIFTVFPIPYDVYEQIFLHLNNQELRNLIKAIPFVKKNK